MIFAYWIPILHTKYWKSVDLFFSFGTHEKFNRIIYLSIIKFNTQTQKKMFWNLFVVPMHVKCVVELTFIWNARPNRNEWQKIEWNRLNKPSVHRSNQHFRSGISWCDRFQRMEEIWQYSFQMQYAEVSCIFPRCVFGHINDIKSIASAHWNTREWMFTLKHPHIFQLSFVHTMMEASGVRIFNYMSKCSMLWISARERKEVKKTKLWLKMQNLHGWEKKSLTIL